MILPHPFLAVFEFTLQSLWTCDIHVKSAVRVICEISDLKKLRVTSKRVSCLLCVSTVEESGRQQCHYLNCSWFWVKTAMRKCLCDMQFSQYFHLSFRNNSQNHNKAVTVKVMFSQVSACQSFCRGRGGNITWFATWQGIPWDTLSPVTDIWWSSLERPYPSPVLTCSGGHRNRHYASY